MTAVQHVTEHIPVVGAVHHGIQQRHYGSEFMKTIVWGAAHLSHVPKSRQNTFRIYYISLTT